MGQASLDFTVSASITSQFRELHSKKLTGSTLYQGIEGVVCDLFVKIVIMTVTYEHTNTCLVP